jgi:DNA-binding winged helix-turn-helix (wHTH) protein/tetratricopeptide (TPR) repeat protein
MVSSQWCFADFRLDPDNARLWRGTQPVPLTPKAFDVLHYLVTHPDRLVTKETLLDVVWPETAISDAVVRIAIGELRRSLGDTAQAPRFIATVHRRGYRFLAPVTVVDAPEIKAVSPSPPVSLTPAPPPLLVGREALLQRLGEAWGQARQGRRQVVWVTGEAGIGKTAVVEAFRATVAIDPAVWLAAGQCVEHYGTGEAYLPVLEALGQLCRGAGGERLVTLLRQHAPTWLVQMPWLLTTTDRQQLRDELQGVTRERMLREFAEVLDALTAKTPLLLVFEDLHWSDYATLDLLALLARRQTPAHLLIVGTYRPVETMVHHHPLRTVVQDLQRHGHALALPLALLNAEAVAAYLAARFPRQQFPAALALWLHQRTDGQPLFLVTLVQALVERGVFYEHEGCWTAQEGLEVLILEVPESLRQLLEHQIIRLPPEAQRVLEVASVAGVEFVAAAVAASLEADTTMVEEHCEALVAQQMLRFLAVTTWPDGTIATRYAFVHALYQQVVYEGLGAGRRVRLHQRLGECLEKTYEAQVGEIAAELAVHFERGHDVRRAVHYLHQAAENATQRSAHHEVVTLLTRALALLPQFPETSERTQHELAIHMLLGPALIATKGHAAPEVQETYARARVLCHQVPGSPQLPQILVGLCLFYVGCGESQTAQAIGRDLLRLAQRLNDPVALLYAQGALGINAFYLGDVVAARVHFERGIALDERCQARPQTLPSLFDYGVLCRIGAAVALQQLGYADQARQRGAEALALAPRLASPYNRCNLLFFLALLHGFRREWPLAQQWAEEALRLAMAHGFLLYIAVGKIVHGATLVAQEQVQEGLGYIRQGVTACPTLGTRHLQPWGLAMVAESYVRLGQPEAGLSALAEPPARMATISNLFYAAEIARLEGILRLQAGGQDPDRGPDMSPTTAAEHCFQRALAGARRQQARWWELRAAVSLARLWQQQGKRTEAHALLAPIYGWFTEGFDTADLQETKTLLDELA